MPIPVAGPAGPGVIPTGLMSYILGSLLVVHNSVDENGVRWGIDYVDGLDGLGDTGQVDQYAADHGGWALPAFHTPRELEVTGWLVSQHWSFTSTAVEQLKAALPLSTLADFVVSIPGDRDRFMRVRQQGKPLFKREGRFCNYSLSLVAPDPRVYSVEQAVVSTGLPSSSGGLQVPFAVPFQIDSVTEAGALTAINDGNMSTPPVLKVSGPCPPFTLRHHSGASLTYPIAVPDGRFVVLDTSKRRALEDGTEPRYVTGTWFEYAPGVNTVRFEAAAYNAAALLTSTHRSAWK